MNKGSLFRRNTRMEGHEKKKTEITKEMVISAVLLTLIGIFLVCLQTRIPKFFGAVVPVTLAFVSATGFIFGEKHGALMGTLLGFLLDCSGGVDLSLCVVFYMLCGFFCGALRGKLLSEGLPSFWVFALIVGLFNSGATAIYFVLFSDELGPVRLVMFTLLPELLSFVAISPLIYLLIYPISKIKKTK